MTTVKTDKGSVIFRWKYGKFSKKNPLDLLENETMCEVSLITDHVHVSELKEASGLAFKSEKDQFSRPEGRYYSLKRAMDSSNFTRKERAEVWNAFHTVWPVKSRKG